MIKPYYRDDWVTIYNGDCLEVMKEILNKSIDLLLTSPPYDDLRTYQSASANSFEVDFKNIAIEIFRIIKHGGVLVWVVGDATIRGSETGTSFKQALYFKEIGFNLHDTMIYQKKECTFPDTNRYLGVFEYMFIFSKDKPKTVNFLMDRQNKSITKKTASSYRQPDGRTKWKIPKEIKEYGRRNNIWCYSTGYQKTTKDKYAFIHPAMFPEKLAEDHILSWSNPGDLILDPFLGSGTTARVCKNLGRKCIGIEISKEYCDIAVQRLGQGVLDFSGVN